MKSRSNELLDRAISAMVSALEIYNKPGFSYRDETFAILAINGWELLLKARWLAIHGNKASSLYVYEKRQKADGTKSKKRFVKRTRSNVPFTRGIDYLAKQMVNTKNLDPSVGHNLDVLREFRNCATHFYFQSSAFQKCLYEVGAACVKNFATATREWFGRELSEFDLHLMPLTFMNLPSNVDGVLLNAVEKNFLSFLEKIDNAESDPESLYSVTVSIDIQFTKSNAKDALLTQITTDPSAPAVRFTEEEIWEKYPWDYNTLTEKCRKLYQNFKVNRDYHAIRKPLHDDPRFAKTRLLNPNNPNSQKKILYRPNILQEFDRHYTRKTTH